MGITRVAPDLFAMSTMYSDLTKLACTPGTGITWSVDLRHADDVSQPRVRKLVEGPDDKSLLNGMAALNKRTALMVDQALGGIWAVDIVKGGATLVISDEAMQDPSDTSNGVNNPSRGTLCSVPIDMSTGKKTVKVLPDVALYLCDSREETWCRWCSNTIPIKNHSGTEKLTGWRSTMLLFTALDFRQLARRSPAASSIHPSRNMATTDRHCCTTLLRRMNFEILACEQELVDFKLLNLRLVMEQRRFLPVHQSVYVCRPNKPVVSAVSPQ